MNIVFFNDNIILSRLKEADVVLCDKSDTELTLLNGVEYFENELLKRTQITIIVFFRYCILPMQKYFQEIDAIKLCIESPAIATLMTMLGGYIQAGMKAEKNVIRNKNHIKFGAILPNLFSKEEFEEMIFCLKFLLSEFPKQAEEAIQWLKDDIEPEKQQMAVLSEFVNFLQKNKSVVADNSELQKIAKKVTTTCMPGGVDNAHNLYSIKAREGFGLLSPDKEFLISIERIFTYLDVLCYAGFIPDGLPETVTELNIRNPYKH